jgi:hypothetical protein
VLGFEPSRLGAHFEHPDAGGIVDIQLHRAQRLEGV